MEKRSGRPDSRLRDQVADEETHCWLCGKPVDYELEYGHPLAFEMDHKNPIVNGGRTVRSNVAASHRRCNRRKGGDVVETEPRRSRDW